ncbi:hypothetical protein SAY87_002204 [Trapa incisa]|uniref:Uncharacterized protein n=1 Tax=Trapa incisa TaxID=236973 RepID=A0AAN7PYY5_9MYRT|nr:hypothetical protein SAY87_002204 [Trapa incisa]
MVEVAEGRTAAASGHHSPGALLEEFARGLEYSPPVLGGRLQILMQSIISSPLHFQVPPLPDKGQFNSPLRLLRSMNSAPKFPALVGSLRTPLHLELGEGEREVRKYYLPGEPGSVVRLPVTVTRSSEVSRYVWDATCLRLISFGGAGSDGGKVPFYLDDLGGPAGGLLGLLPRRLGISFCQSSC